MLSINKLAATIFAGNCPFIQGHPGTAKTAYFESLEVLQALGKYASILENRPVKVVCIHVPVQEAADKTDVTGYPHPISIEVENVDGKIETVNYFGYYPPKWVIQVLQNHAKKLWSLVVLDEINRTEGNILQPLMGVFTSLTLCGVPLPKTALFIATGNLGEEDGCDVTTMDGAQIRRVVPFIWTMTFKEWCEHFAKKERAIRRGQEESIVLPELLVFLEQYLDLFCNKYQDPRGWTRLSNALSMRIAIEPDMSRQDAIMQELEWTGKEHLRENGSDHVALDRLIGFLEGYYRVTFDTVCQHPECIPTLTDDQIHNVFAGMRDFLLDCIKQGRQLIDFDELLKKGKPNHPFTMPPNEIIQTLIGRLSDEEAIALHTLLRTESEQPGSANFKWHHNNLLIFKHKQAAINAARAFKSKFVKTT